MRSLRLTEVCRSPSKGWKKEIKLISWNQKEAKYDIREWSPDGEKMGKGVTLSKEEIINLRDLLNKIDRLISLVFNIAHVVFGVGAFL